MEIAFLITIFSVLIAILILANLADRERERDEPQQPWAVLTYLTLSLFWAGFFAFGLLFTSIGAMYRFMPDLAATMGEAGGQPMATNFIASLPQIGLGMWVPALFGLLLLLPPVRRLFARFTQLDPASAVHAVALSYTMLIMLNLWVTVAIGIDTLADMTAEGPALDTGSLVQMTWTQELLFALTAIIGVGWLIRRGWGQSLSRLGFVLPTWRQALVGLGLGIGMAAILIPLEMLLEGVGIGFDEDVSRLSEQLIGPLTESWFGILTLGLAAALGEELVFRGAMQPRFGLILTSLLFALLHSNYGITLSTGLVFMVGIVLGLVRLRANTSTSMIVHAAYNITIGAIAFFSLVPDW